ncbi:dTDP-4-dehydrorhamnose 3,5-epimerase [Gammaproteobacteria bacterium]|nr:dTDP-4-dehydrorhamnose 3,5-epimerase [Gammaproteobacteria bacterium]
MKNNYKHSDISLLDGCKLIKRKAFYDDRGVFSEMFRENTFSDINFVQDNFSHSTFKGTFRGLHFQSPPYDQSKFISVLSGAILDFFVDLRPESSSFLKHASYHLTDSSNESLFIPKGFAHGFLTLKDNTKVFYKVDNYYSSDHDHTLLWNDPAINLEINSKDIQYISNKDSQGFTSKQLISKGLIYAK